MESKGFIPAFMQLRREEQKAAVEALIFSSEEAVTNQQLFAILINSEIFNSQASAKDSSQPSLAEEASRQFEIPTDYFDTLINDINGELIATGRPFQILRIAGGWQYSTRPEYGRLLVSLHKSKAKKRLSQAALETLAIVAYRQPITKPEVEQIRGVNSGEVVNSLLEKGLLEINGRRDTLGKPLTYGTTPEFLRMFGMFGLEDLPKLKSMAELDELLPSDEVIEITVDTEQMNDSEIETAEELLKKEEALLEKMEQEN